MFDLTDEGRELLNKAVVDLVAAIDRVNLAFQDIGKAFLKACDPLLELYKIDWSMIEKKARRRAKYQRRYERIGKQGRA